MSEEIQTTDARAIELPRTVKRYIPLMRINKDKWQPGHVCKTADEALGVLTDIGAATENCRIIAVELPL